MAAAWSEYRRIRDDLRRMPAIFDLTKGRLAEQLFNLVVEGIVHTAAQEKDPDGNPWPPLSDAYAAWKAEAYPGEPTNYREGLMLARDQLDGGRWVSAHEARMEYGTDEDARDEAVAAHEGGPNRPPRPFYGISPGAAGYMGDLCDERFRDFFD